MFKEIEPLKCGFLKIAGIQITFLELLGIMRRSNQ